MYSVMKCLIFGHLSQTEIWPLCIDVRQSVSGAQLGAVGQWVSVRIGYGHVLDACIRHKACRASLPDAPHDLYNIYDMFLLVTQTFLRPHGLCMVLYYT